MRELVSAWRYGAYCSRVFVPLHCCCSSSVEKGIDRTYNPACCERLQLYCSVREVGQLYCVYVDVGLYLFCKCMTREFLCVVNGMREWSARYSNGSPADRSRGDPKAGRLAVRCMANRSSLLSEAFL